MYAYNVSTKKRGRPFRFSSENNLNIKKKELFENENYTKQQMSLVNLAYHTNKITKDEKDIATFLESLFIKVQKHLNIKKLPSCAPNTWNGGIRSTYQNSQYQDEKAINTWMEIKNHVEINEPAIAKDFFKLICSHLFIRRIINNKTKHFCHE